MHEYAKVSNGTFEPDRFRVAPDAVKEYIGRVKDKKFDTQPKNKSEFLELVRVKIVANIPEICKIAQGHSRKTVYDVDVIEFFGYIGRNVI